MAHSKNKSEGNNRFGIISKKVVRDDLSSSNGNSQTT